MTTLAQSLEVQCLAAEQTSKLELMISEQFARLKSVCDYIQECKVNIVNVARHQKTPIDFAYLVSINITMPEGFDLYTLRTPQENRDDSIEDAIYDVFAMVYRKLIEVKLERY